jgi:hypothetical protein
VSTSFYPRDAARQETRHLGQQNTGSQFLFRAYPDRGITGTSSWLRQLEGAQRIRDEYGRPYTAAEMIAIVAECQAGKPRPLHGTDWRDTDGSAFCEAEFC